MTQEIYWELLAWLFRSFLAVTAFAFVVAGYQALRCRPRDGSKRRPCAAARAGAAAVKNRRAGGRFTVRHGMPSRFLREMFLTLWGIEEFRGCAPSYLGGPS